MHSTALKIVPALLLLLASLLMIMPAHAERGIPWQQLSTDERALLQPHAPPRWASYPPDRQQALRDGARRYLTMPPGQRKKIDKKRREYQQMTPEQRRRLRESYKKNRP